MASTPESKKFADRLSDLLDEARSKKEDYRTIAKVLGISTGALSNYANDVQQANLTTVARIADYFHVSTDWLLGRTGDPSMRPCATDELGLTPKAIAAIQQMRRDNQTEWLSDGLNAIMECDKFPSLIYCLLLYATVGDKRTGGNGSLAAALKIDISYKEIYQMKLNATVKDIADSLSQLFDGKPDYRDMYKVYLSIYMHKMPDGRYCTLEEIQRDFEDMGLEFDPLLFEGRERLGYMP